MHSWTELKKDNPFQYWVRAVFLAMVLVVVIIILAESSKGAYTASTFNVSDNGPFYKNLPTHTKDNYLVAPYVNSDTELWVAYKKPGDSWSRQLIADNDWNGGSQIYKAVATTVTSNNTLLIFGQAKNGAIYPAILWIKYPDSDWDDWDHVWISSFTAAPYDMEVNNTDRVCMVYQRSGNKLYVCVYDILNETKNEKEWVYYTNVYGRCAANMTGVFWIEWSTGYLWIQDFDQEEDAIRVYNTAMMPGDFACLDNDRFIITLEYGSGINYRLDYYYQYQHQGYFARIDSIVTGNIDRPYFSLRDGSTLVTIIAYSYADTKLYEFQNSWNGSQAGWQSSKTEIGNDGNTLAPKGGFCDLWPRYNGISFTRPDTGVAIVIENEAGSEDAHQLWTDSTNWTGDLTTDPPEITTEALDDGETDDFYTMTITADGGVEPLTWQLLTGPAWLSLGSSNGTLYGACGDPGNYEVTVRVTDDLDRTDEETWTLRVVQISEAEDEGEGWNIDFDPLLGALWWLFIVTCTFVAILTTILEYVKDRKRGRK